MRRAGFTIIELLVIVFVVIALLFVVTVAITPAPRVNHRWMRDSVQLRGIQQSLITWSGSNDDKYPLPSTIDVDNFTVPELGRAKDTTANIMSLLVYEGFITAELLVSPLENNDRVQVYEDYEIEDISGAVDPEKALWDPKLSADFTSDAGGNISYAHLIPDQSRLAVWGSTFKAEEAILSNRGPEMRSTERTGGNVVTYFADLGTNTTRLYDGPDHKTGYWSGNIAFNDSHVDFVNNLYADNKPVGDPKAEPRLFVPSENGELAYFHDVLFSDEQAPDGKDNWREAYDANQFLGIFTTAGESREDFTAIWD
mgnify:CR=1 FL=1